jgi:hypothetical protein
MSSGAFPPTTAPPVGGVEGAPFQPLHHPSGLGHQGQPGRQIPGG